jgi:hypothetical protein
MTEVTYRPIKWKIGCADDVWKLIVCANDAKRASDLLSGVAYILDNPGHVTDEQYADVLRKFTGEQIADALLDYRNRAMLSIMKAASDQLT